MRRLLLLLLHERPDPNLPPVGDPPSPSAMTSVPRRKICCEFCDCELVGSGEILKMSDTARGYRDLKEKHERLKADLADVEQKYTKEKTEHDALKAEHKKGWW
jgi:hypothetical protein